MPGSSDLYIVLCVCMYIEMVDSSKDDLLLMKILVPTFTVQSTPLACRQGPYWSILEFIIIDGSRLNPIPIGYSSVASVSLPDIHGRTT